MSLMRLFEEVAQIFGTGLTNPTRDVYADLPNSKYKLWMPWLDGQQHGKWLNEWDPKLEEIQETNTEALLDSKAELKISDEEMRLVWGNFIDGPKFLGVFQYQKEKSRQGVRIYKRV